MMESDLYKMKRKLMHEFSLKLSPMSLPLDEEMWDEWIEVNWSKTKFAGKEEATKLKNKMLKTMEMLKEQYADVYQLIKRATLEQRMIILRPEMDLIRKHVEQELNE